MYEKRPRRDLLNLWVSTFLRDFVPNPLGEELLKDVGLIFEEEEKTHGPMSIELACAHPNGPHPLYTFAVQLAQRWHAPFSQQGVALTISGCLHANDVQMMVAVVVKKFNESKPVPGAMIDAAFVNALFKQGIVPRSEFLAQMWRTQQIHQGKNGIPPSSNLLDCVVAEDFAAA